MRRSGTTTANTALGEGEVNEDDKAGRLTVTTLLLAVEREARVPLSLPPLHSASSSVAIFHVLFAALVDEDDDDAVGEDADEEEGDGGADTRTAAARRPNMRDRICCPSEDTLCRD